MADRAFEVAKKVFRHRNGTNLTLWEWLNDDKQFFLFKCSYINDNLYLEKNSFKAEVYWSMQFSHQSSTLVVAKDSNISLYLNLTIQSLVIILSII